MDSKGKNADELALFAIDVGADDVSVGDGEIEVYTSPQNLEVVRKGLERRGLTITSTELLMVAKTTVDLDEKHALQTLKLLDHLEELDDVQRVSSNANFSDAVLAKYAEA